MSLTEQVRSKHDYIADTQAMRLLSTGNGIQFGFSTDNWQEKSKFFEPTQLFHSQISQHTKVPQAYYDRMRVEAPELLVENVNHWLDKQPSKRMVRTIDNTARAFLSSKYRALDNYDLMTAIVPFLSNTELQITSCDLTETRLYIKAISPKVEGEIKKGDIVQAGVVISNSEVGAGALSVLPLIYHLVCTNGLIMEDSNRMRKYHTGSRHKNSDGEDAWEIYSDETKAASDKAIFLQARDLVQNFLKQEYFDNLLKPIRAAAGVLIENKNLPEVIEKTIKTFTLTEDEGTGIMQYLAAGGALTKWGLAEAVTRLSQDSISYDRATELERIGGRIVELEQPQWKAIAA